MSASGDRLRALLDTGPFPGKGALAYRGFVSVAAIIGTGVNVAATVQNSPLGHGPIAFWLELAAVLALTLDFALHVLLAIDARPGTISIWRAVGRYLASPWGIIDWIAILPYYVARFGILPEDWVILLGMFRMMKLSRFSPALGTLQAVLRREWRPLQAAVLIMLLVMLGAATLLYFAERQANPNSFSSIPQAMWWSVVTLTTLGYGDMVPITPLGKVLGGIVAVLGIGMFGMSASILATGFSEEMRRRDFLHTWHMLAKVPILSGLNADQIAALTEILRYMAMAPGDVLMRKGDLGDRMYFIVSGELRVDFGGGTRLLRDGDFVGEIALLHLSPRTATVTAESRCQLLALDVKDFRQFLAGSPEMAKIISETAKSRLQELDPTASSDALLP
jgi:voltage-gated potassium channel